MQNTRIQNTRIQWTCRRWPAFVLLLVALAVPSQSRASAPSPAYTIHSTSNGFSIQVSSGTETLNYQWIAPPITSLYSLGSMLVTDSVAGASPAGQLPVASSIDWIGPSERLQSIAYQTSGPVAATLTFAGPTGTTHITLMPMVVGQFAAIRMTADRATIKAIHLGQLPPAVVTQQVTVPYYSQAVTYIGSLDLFENAYFDQFDSRATTVTNTAGPATFYATNDKGTANPLGEIWKISVSQNIMNVLPAPAHPASPYMAQLAGRMVMEVRGGNFPTIAAQLANLGDYGINHCAVIIGDWQYFGYDNGLPAEYPANPTLGGDAGMEAISAAARSNGCYFALHENYADYYPDYPGYTPSAIMLKPNGAQLVSWLNTATGMQAFATKPGLFVTNAATQSPLIHQNYGTNASFLDVNSSAAPSWRADQDASTFGAGMFAIYRDASISLFAYERAIEQGPVFGEGKYHWFYSGLLDGVEAQFGSEYPRLANGLIAPLFVDFDLMRIHPLQVNYGMGYYDRWMPGGTTITSTLALDAYRMQEVIFGHAPYLTDALWSSAPRALLEQNLVSPLAARSALQTASNVAYQVDGAWVDASGAAKAGNFSLVQVSYPNGDSVIANGLPSTFVWNGLQIPQYGWAAQGAGYVAYTALLGGQIADYSQTSQSIFANARNQADLLADGTLAAPSLVAMQQVGPRALALQLQWNVNTPGPSTPYREFIHFVPSNTPSGSNALTAQLSASPAVPTTSWTTGQIVTDQLLTFTLPANMADGDYQIRVGLFNGLERAALYGNNDGNLRYTVGGITLSNNGANLALRMIPAAIAQPDARMNSTGAVLNFGTLSTDGMVWIQQQTGTTQSQLRISTYPRSRNVVVKINSATLPMPASLLCDNGDAIAPLAVSGGNWQVNLRSRKYCSWNGALPH